MKKLISIAAVTLIPAICIVIAVHHDLNNRIVREDTVTEKATPGDSEEVIYTTGWNALGDGTSIYMDESGCMLSDQWIDGIYIDEAGYSDGTLTDYCWGTDRYGIYYSRKAYKESGISTDNVVCGEDVTIDSEVFTFNSNGYLEIDYDIYTPDWWYDKTDALMEEFGLCEVGDTVNVQLFYGDERFDIYHDIEWMFSNDYYMACSSFVTNVINLTYPEGCAISTHENYRVRRMYDYLRANEAAYDIVCYNMDIRHFWDDDSYTPVSGDIIIFTKYLLPEDRYSNPNQLAFSHTGIVGPKGMIYSDGTTKVVDSNLVYLSPLNECGYVSHCISVIDEAAEDYIRHEALMDAEANTKEDTTTNHTSSISYELSDLNEYVDIDEDYSFYYTVVRPIEPDTTEE